jgi:hypothetical protein
MTFDEASVQPGCTLEQYAWLKMSPSRERRHG